MTCCDQMARDLNHSCDQHPDRAACPDAMIERVRGGHGLFVRTGKNGYANSVVEIAYCPWCGTRLPPIGDLDLTAPPDEGG